MKLEEFRNRLNTSKEYSDAKQELSLHFDLANAVLKARINKGWSQKQLAEEIGTKQANISRIEAGLANPTLNVIKKLINALDINIDISYVQKPLVEFTSIQASRFFASCRLDDLFSEGNICSDFNLNSYESETQEKVLA